MSEESERGSVRVVGTAHVSAESVRDVEDAIAEETPDVVAVELDESRFRQLKGETPDDLDSGDLLQGNTVYQFLAYWMLSYVQTRLGERFDIKPGADMLAAVESAERLGIDVALVDRDIQVTIQRFWSRLSTLEKAKLLAGLGSGFGNTFEIALGIGLGISVVVAILAGAVGGPYLIPSGLLTASIVGILDTIVITIILGSVIGVILLALLSMLQPSGDKGIEELDIERLTDTDVVSAMMAEFRRFSPGGAEALIDERDAYIAHQLVTLRDSGRDVVAVVGAGHQAGIERYLEQPSLIPDIQAIQQRDTTRRFSLYKAFGYFFTLGFLAFFILLAIATFTGVEGASSGLLIRLFGAWFIVNAIFAFSHAKIAGAHWTSAGVGGAIAWLTSVNPLLAPGWFAGYVELRYLQVNVGDISKLNEILADEALSFRDLWSRLSDVPLFRLILIVALTNVGSFIGSIVFAAVFIPYLFADAGITSASQVANLMIQAILRSIDLIIGVFA